MSDKTLKSSVAPPQPDAALSRWANEGGAVPRPLTSSTSLDATAPSPDATPRASSPQSAAPQPVDAEWEQLRVRVIALENLVIALLAESSAPQLKRARAMASHIAPRPGFTHHPLTIHAAAQMIHLVQRGGHFRAMAPPAPGHD